MAHCKKSLRQLLVNGKTRLPDLAHDADWRAEGDEHDETDVISYCLKEVLRYALRVQHCFHSLDMACSLRFTPIGWENKPWGFSFDDKQMELFDPPELRPSRELLSVQLVCQPMLVDSGLYDKDNGKVLTQHAPMSVVTSRVYTGDEAEEYTWDMGKSVERRRAKRHRLDARREARLPAEAEVMEGRRRGKTARTRNLEKREVEAQREKAKYLLAEQKKQAEDLLAEQERKANELRDEQKKKADELLVNQQRKARELQAKQQAERNKSKYVYK